MGGFILSFLIIAAVGGIGFIRTQVENMMDTDVSLLKNADDLKILAFQHRRYEKDFFLNIGKKRNKKNTLRNSRPYLLRQPSC